MDTTRHDPPLQLIDPRDGRPFPCPETRTDARGNVWAAVGDMDCYGVFAHEPDYNAAQPHWIIVQPPA